MRAGVVRIDYVSAAALKRGAEMCPLRRSQRQKIEGMVVEQIRALVSTPEIVVRVWHALRHDDHMVTEAEVRTAPQGFDDLWAELFPAEQARIVQLLVECVDVAPDEVQTRLRLDGVVSLVQDLRAPTANERRAA